MAPVMIRPLTNIIVFLQYISVVEDEVIGVVVARGADSYRVDIGSSRDALLPFLAFEGATKRNRPNLAVGTLVYARVQMANKVRWLVDTIIAYSNDSSILTPNTPLCIAGYED